VDHTQKKNADHLVNILKTHHGKISQDWEGKKFSDINLEWNYAPNHAGRMCCLSMKNYISNLLVALNHPALNRLQLSPRRCQEIKHSSKVQHAHNEDTTASLNTKDIQCVKQIVRSLLWIAPAVNNK
jgi:hypothetical protein